jgi:hypothetical protein
MRSRQPRLPGQPTANDIEASGQASVLLDSAATELPTAIFRQIFISHAGPYAIINPAKRSSVAAALATVTPLQQ